MKMKKIVTGLGLLLVALMAFGSPTQANTLEKIKARGKIIVGVKADYKPWGFLGPDGRVIGLEVDLAQDIADRLGVGLELVAVQTANRIEFLQQGRIDLMIATMSVNPKRQEQVGCIEPFYYAGGTSVIARKNSGIKKWEDLRGKRVCATQGAYYNRPVAEKFGAEIVAFPGTPEAQTDLLAGNCIAFLQDSTLHDAALASGDPKWADFEMPLPTIDPAPWAIAVPSQELNGPYGKYMSDVVTDWHKTGKLVELQKKWGMNPNPFLDEMHAKYKGM